MGLKSDLVVAALLASMTLQAASAPPADPAIPVVTGNVAQEDVATYITGVGTVQAAQSVTVRARVDGQLDRIAFNEGQDVRQGELLAQIDPRPLQAQLDQAQAQKARDEASLAAALKDLERYSTLVSQGSLQRQALDTQQATANQLRASVQADQALIDNARVQLGYTTIRAPISGRTGMRLIDAGNMVRATDTTGVVVINQIDPIAVVFTVPEAAFQSVNQAMQAAGGKPLAATALARGDDATLATGRLLALNNRIDTATGTIQLKASFANPKHTLWPGQYVNVRVELGSRRGALTVPVSAVQRGANGLFVYVVGGDHSVAVRPVKLVQSQDGKAVLESGLRAGESIVVDGQSRLKPGAHVVEASRSAAAPSAAAPAARP